MFEDFGLIEAQLSLEKFDDPIHLEERLTEDAIDCGAEDVELLDSEKQLVHVCVHLKFSLNLSLFVCF